MGKKRASSAEGKKPAKKGKTEASEEAPVAKKHVSRTRTLKSFSSRASFDVVHLEERRFLVHLCTLNDLFFVEKHAQ